MSIFEVQGEERAQILLALAMQRDAKSKINQLKVNIFTQESEVDQVVVQ